MRSDFERVLRFFASRTETEAEYTEIEEEDLYEFCRTTIVEGYEETIEAMVFKKLLFKQKIVAPELGKNITVFKLTPNGIEQTKILYRLNLENDKINSKSNLEIEKLIDKVESSSIETNRKRDYILTLKEISDCFNSGCYTATIAMCGKLIEIYLTELLTNNGIKIEVVNSDKNGRPLPARTELTLWELNALTSKLPENKDIIFTHFDTINSIRRFRNGTVHYKENIQQPEKEDAMLIILHCINIMNNRLKTM